MSAVVKRIPHDQRLRITAKYDHETICYNGNVFEFLERLMAEKYTGIATVHLRTGGVMAMEFDLRREIPIKRDSEGGKTILDTVRD